jgi:hypothetical protein
LEDLSFMGSRYIDLTGRSFGKLTAKYIVEKEGADGQKYWFCECECGGSGTYRSDVLRKRGTKDCGCINRIELAGKKFGKLTVIEDKRVGRRGVRFWKCSCDCGKDMTKLVSTRQLQIGHITSCGCAQNPEGSYHPSFGGYEGIYGGFWNQIKDGASKRGWSFYINIKDAWDLFERQGRKCALTGLLLSMGKKSRVNPESTTASLDRIDSSKPYTLDNVQWVHKDINMMKRNMDEKRFVELCRAVAAKFD